MNRWITLAMAVGAASVVGVVAAPFAVPVDLQTATPGSPQTGHANITGTMIAGSFKAKGTTATAQVVVGDATATTGSTYAGLFRNYSSSGRAVRGLATGSSGLAGDFQADGSWGSAVKAIATSAGGTPNGVLSTVSSPGGIGIYALNQAASGGPARAIYGLSSSTSGNAVAGRAMAASGYTSGIFGEVASPDGSGVLGRNVSTAGGYGVYGHSQAETGYGLYGYGTGTAVYGLGEVVGVVGRALATYGTGVSGTGVVGVKGVGLIDGVFGEGVNGGSGVRGYATGGGAAMYANGDLFVSGTKSFVIDHPFDPENKFLVHYCSEGPEPTNRYRGRVVTDESGYAWVQMPDYFSEVNRDPMYVLTVVDGSDDFVQAKVTKEIQDNRFQVRTSKPGVKVCWEVTAVRNDLYVRKYGAPTVKDKGKYRGLYDHPELYGKGPDKRIGSGSAQSKPEAPKDPLPNFSPPPKR